MFAAKETICSRCFHVKVCKYIEEMTEILESVDDISTPGVFNVSVGCELYHGETVRGDKAEHCFRTLEEGAY